MPNLLEYLNILGPASQSNPLRGNVYSDALDQSISDNTAKIPGPNSPVVGPEHAAQLMSHYGDAANALSVLGVKPGFSGIRRQPAQATPNRSVI
jgi:hypothetical protein